MEPQSGTTTGDRLESWKEIASHLRRDVRTVQRWEQTDALPVHRHERAGRPIPYAYKGELDAWWTNRSADTSLSSVDSHRTVGSAGRRRLVGAVVAGFSLVLLAGVYVIVRGHAAAAHRPSGSSAETGWRVTTQSPSALKLFSEANALGEKDGWGPAEPLLREAIRQDQGFASAHILLAWALANRHRPPAEFEPEIARAEQLASSVSEAERLFIRGSALQLRGHWKEACASFEAVVRVQPDHYWATNNMARCRLLVDDDRVAAADFFARRADLRPQSIPDNVVAAWANEFLSDDVVRARPYLERAERLQRDGVYSHYGWIDAWLRLRPAYRKWLRNDVDGAFYDLTDTIARTAGRLNAFQDEELHVFSGAFMLTLGRAEEAERIFGQEASETGRQTHLAVVAYARANHPRANRLLQTDAAFAGGGGICGIICARTGFDTGARAILAGERVSAGDQWSEAIEGELAFQAGDLKSAEHHLVAALRLWVQPTSVRFLAAETLAQIFVRTNRLDDAISVLEAAGVERQHTYHPLYDGPFAGYFWLRVQLLQAQLYARQSRIAESRTLAEEMVTLLRHADSKFPVLLEAQRLLRSYPLHTAH